MECYCGKIFYQLNAFTNHQRHCKTSQTRLTSALSKAQQIWARKRESHRLKHLQEPEAVEENNPGETSVPPVHLSDHAPQNEEPASAAEPVPPPMVCNLYPVNDICAV